MINQKHSIYAIKHLVFEEKKYTLEELQKAAEANFEGYEKIRKDLIDCDKYINVY
ncbi:hypothetical protein DIC82_18385 [Clostridium beijerinckii]|nr:hypothetical protein DIC82_18385 [Clostridium beijerinckii]